MRAEDLMIGDWYAFQGHPYKCTASDIASIAECEENGVPTDIPEVPISLGFMVRNGFGIHKNRFGFESYELGNDYLLENRGDKFCLVRRIPGHKYSTFWICNCYYIHQVQHAIRLLGIDKEINL